MWPTPYSQNIDCARFKVEERAHPGPINPTHLGIISNAIYFQRSRVLCLHLPVALSTSSPREISERVLLTGKCSP